MRTKIVTAAAALLLSSGCATENTCPTDWCGTLVVLSAPAVNLFPPTPYWDVDVGLTDLMFLHLADVGRDLNTVGDEGFIPRLAESWSFDDSLTISFAIHPDARWHDGTTVTAADVAFTFDVYRDPAVPFSNRARIDDIESVTAQDERTAVFRFKRHYLEQFFDAVAHMHVLPQHLLDTIPRENLSTHEFSRSPIGSGPYRFVSWNPDEAIELTGDSAFFLGHPGIRRIVWRFVRRASNAVDEMLVGSADFVHQVSNPADVARLAGAAHVKLIEYPSNTYNYIGFNLRDPEDLNRPHPLFGNRALRHALAMAVDVETIVTATLGDQGIVAAGPAPPSLWIWSEDLTPRIPFDTTEAIRVLNELGWRDTDGDGVLDREGRALSFELLSPPLPMRPEVSEILQSQLARIGVRMRIEMADFTAFTDRVQRGQFDTQFSSIGFDASPSGIKDWTSDAIGGLNYGAYTNSEFDALVRSAVLAPDRATALSRWRDAIAIIAEDVPAIWLYYPKRVAAVHERFSDAWIRPDQAWAALSSYHIAPTGFIERDLLGVN